MAAYKDLFVPGFTKYLMDNEGASQEKAEEITNRVWTIINDAASYMFCAAHALSMANDSLYGAYLKAHYPFEFYSTMLRIFTEKGKKEKVAAIIAEMKRYKGIRLTPGRLGQDNRDWFIDKENNTISQAMTSVKFVSKSATNQLYHMSEQRLPHFIDALRYMQMNTTINARQIRILIGIGYFERYGLPGKLYKLFDEFFNGENRLTKSLVEKTVKLRMEKLIELEKSMPNEDINIFKKLQIEYENLGLCLSTTQAGDGRNYFLQEIDDQYGVKLYVYNISKAKSGIYRVRKDALASSGLKKFDGFHIDGWTERKKMIMRNGERVYTKEPEYWITSLKKIYNYVPDETEQEGE